MLIGTTVFAGAEATYTIPVPDVPAIDRPYKSIDELGIDYEKIDAYFPQRIEIRYEDGRVYVEDFGASSIEIYDSNGYVSLELTDGYWTAELSSAPTIIHVYAYETSFTDKHLNAAYRGDGFRDPYINLNDYNIDINVSFSLEYENVTVLYESGNYYYEDRYEDGALNTHGVSNREDKENTNQVLYGVDGKIRYCTLYVGGYYYYFPGQGWSSNWEYFVACDAPVGYEDIDETYFTANKPSLICEEAQGDDIVHDMSTPYCTAPSTCKNGCGYTVGTIEHHDWQSVDGKKECSLCDAVFFPEFEFIDRSYNTIEESGFPYDEIKAVFPKVLTVKYEDGKYMVKDVGADTAIAYNNVDYEDIELSLVDGWWICELDEETYNDESIKLFVCFEGEIDGINWDITYINGETESDLYLWSIRDDLSVSVYYKNYDMVAFTYYVGDRLYRDEYKNGALASQEGSLFVGEDHVYITYLADGSFGGIRVYIDDEWYYYYPDGSWEKGVQELLDPPLGYENADVAYFESILPTTINCTHENIKEADCENPEYCLTCGIVSAGSEPLGHKYVGELTENSTCSSVGKMTYTCQNDKSHVYTEEVAIDENAHAWNEGTVTTDPTCTKKGIKTFTCMHNSEHTYTEDVDELGHSPEQIANKQATCTESGLTAGTKCSECGEILAAQTEIAATGHKYDNACDADCNTCGEVRTPAEHYSENADGKCDVCGESFKLSGGAVAGIVTGSVSAIGGGGFALWWFVFRKKRLF